MNSISMKATKPSPKASQGYLMKLARVVNSRHHNGYNDAKFCLRHGIVKTK